MAKEYWFCMIGSTEREQLPQGSDFPMRMAVREKYQKVTGEEDDICSSGWGLDQDTYDVVSKLLIIKTLYPKKYKSLRNKIMKDEVKD